VAAVGLMTVLLPVVVTASIPIDNDRAIVVVAEVS
jgi:hypothetical protein